MPVRLDHIQVVVPPALEAAAKRFYGALLGLRELTKPPGPRQNEGAWYDAGAAQLHLALETFDPAGRGPSGRMSGSWSPTWPQSSAR